MPAAEVVGDSIGDAEDMGFDKLEVSSRGKKPNFAEAELHSKRTGTTGINSEHAIFVIALENETLAPKRSTPELQSHHDRQQLQRVNVVTESLEDESWKGGLEILALKYPPAPVLHASVER